MAAKILAEHNVHYEDAVKALSEIKMETETAHKRIQIQSKTPTQPAAFNLDAYTEDWTKLAAIGANDDALTAIVELAKERFPEEPLLATARNLLDEVCAYAWVKATEPPEEIRKSRDEIEKLKDEEEEVARALGREQAAKLPIEKQELQKSHYERMLSE